jgi:hypothetical protein
MKNIMLLLLSMGLFAQEGIMEVQRIKEENGLESAVLILGEAHGEKIRLIWDFQKIGPGPFTNGVMDTQIVSGMPAVSLRVHNDFGGARFQRLGNGWFASPWATSGRTSPSTPAKKPSPYHPEDIL